MTEQADLVTAEIVRNGLTGAADQMRVSLIRTAFSPIIYEVIDFAATLYDTRVRLLAQAQALPLFMGTLGHAITATLERVGGADGLVDGDVLFNTYAYDIGSHPQDAVVIVPIFHDGELLGYSAVKAHHRDIGAIHPYCTDTTDNFQEGTIFPGVKLYRAGELQEDLYRTLVANSRLPRALVGDLSAQIGSAKLGAAGLLRLVDRYGVDRFRAATEVMFEQGEAEIRGVLETIPDGRYTAAGAMDSDGITDDPVPFEVAVEVRGSDVLVDLTNAPEARPGPINTPAAGVRSGVNIGIMSIAGPGYSANEGHFAPIEVRTKPGTMFDPAPPSPIFLYGWPMQQVIDLIHRALADALPERVPAGSGGDVCALTFWGHEDGDLWIDGGDHVVGQGGTRSADANAPLIHISCSGIRNLPVEIWESKRRSLVERFEFAPDSAGVGRYRGGPGVDVRYRLEQPMTMTISLERTKTAPWGLHGGGAGRPNGVTIHEPSGVSTGYSKVSDLAVPAGSVVELRTGGGGGYGPPAERDPLAVRDDVVDGIVTAEAAAEHYPDAVIA